MKQNIHQMIREAQREAGQAPFGDTLGRPVYIRRDSWHDEFVEIVGVAVPPSQWPPNKAPYFGNPTVFMLCKYRSGEAYTLKSVPVPGTYGYARQASAPPWWRQGIDYPVTNACRDRLFVLSSTVRRHAGGLEVDERRAVVRGQVRRHAGGSEDDEAQRDVACHVRRHAGGLKDLQAQRLGR